MVSRLNSPEYERAAQRTERDGLTVPRARIARYDRRSRQIIVELTNSAKFEFPADLAQGLAGASGKDLNRIEISPSGEALRWPALDADFSLPELMRGIFGTRAWMQRLRRESRLFQKTVTSSTLVRS